MESISASPFRGAALAKLKNFLRGCGLKYDKRIEYSLCLIEDDEILATGSLDGSVLKCLAVSPERENEGLAAKIISGLLNEAARRSRFHLFLFTKPENQALFSGLGFFPVEKTKQVLLMENKKHGVAQFVASLKWEEAGPSSSLSADASRAIGAIVANCNPFTLGHLYLIETASKQCGLLYLFVVSEDKSAFSAEIRLELVRQGVSRLSNVRLCPTGPYLVSSATFPDYFLKESAGEDSPRELNTELDLAIFAEHFAKPLGISRRYVGSEPFDPVTSVYNRQMKEVLPSYGIDVIEIKRLENAGEPLSASLVRRLLEERNLDAARELVPPATYEYLEQIRKREKG
jgi:[citrate (pro-3S)-lyase] ligase